MSLAVRRTAPAAVLVACALAAAPAHAQTRPGTEPPLTADPPVALSGATPAPTATATPTATAAPTAAATAAGTATPREELPRTGSGAGLIALAGASLLGVGLSLRRLSRLDGAG